MKIYYIKDRNCTYSDEEKSILAKLGDEYELKPIYIRRCPKSRYLCKRERMRKLNSDLSKVSKKSVIIFFNFIHLGKSYEEISSILLENSQRNFNYVYPESMEDFPFCKELVVKNGFKICSINHYYFQQISKEYIKKLRIQYGERCSKRKMRGRIKGSMGKHSDYDPYKDKILEGLERKMSTRSIIIYIRFGTYSGLKYYIEHQLKPFL